MWKIMALFFCLWGYLTHFGCMLWLRALGRVQNEHNRWRGGPFDPVPMPRLHVEGKPENCF